LSIVALPKIMGVSDDARQASVDAVAAVLTGISTNNYVTRSTDATKGLPALTCNALVTLLDGGVLKAGFDFNVAQAASAIANDSIATDCLVHTSTTPVMSATFTQRGTD
jgi:hypothetical protein